MPFKIKVKTGSTAPPNGSLDTSELGFDSLNKKLYVGTGTGTAPATLVGPLTLADIGAASNTHLHGNITNAGAIGSTSNLVVTTGTSGVLTTLSRSGIDSRATFPATQHTIASHSATAWRMFFSNATTTAVQELQFGTSQHVLTSNGATSAPTWSPIPVPTSVASSGLVTISGGDGVSIESGPTPIKFVLDSQAGTATLDSTGLSFKSGATTVSAFSALGEYLLHFAKSWDATTSTAAATAAKVVTLSGYTLKPGNLVEVLFTTGNSVNTPTLNINSTGAKNITINGTNVTTSNFTISANTRAFFYYNGSTYELISSELTAGSNVTGSMSYSGTTSTAGSFDGGITNPSSTTRLNYNGNLHATNLYASNTVHIGTGTQQTWEIDATSDTVLTIKQGTTPTTVFTLGSEGQLRSVAGTAGVPVYSFVGDPNTGFFNSAADALAIVTNSTTRLTINSDGLLIAPAGTTSNPSIRWTSGLGIFSNNSNELYFATNSITRMTISAATAIVTTLPIRGQDGSASTPAFSFSGDTNNGMYRITTDVIGFATNSTERVRLQTPSTTVGAMRVTVPAVNNTYNVEFFNGTAAVGRISTTSTATTYSTSSDYRLKKDIVEMDSLEAINKIMQLRPVDFKWKIDDHESNGFIAHELQEVFPEAVSGIKDQTVEVGNVLDSEGNIISENIQKPAEIKEDEQWVKIKDEEIYQGVDTSFLVATLVKAVQAQQETIQELKARIEALEN